MIDYEGLWVVLFMVGVLGFFGGVVYGLVSGNKWNKGMAQSHKQTIEDKDREIEYWKQKFIGETRK